MTTNHYDKLDPALIRPGRVDIHEILDDAAGEQAARLFRKFYGGSPAGTAEERTKARVWREGEEVLDQGKVEEMARRVQEVIDANRQQGRTVSMASLQGHFIRHSATEACEQVESLCKPAVTSG